MHEIIPATKVRTQSKKFVQSYRHRQLIKAMDDLSVEFTKTLRKRGINPNKLTEKQVAKLLNL